MSYSGGHEWQHHHLFHSDSWCQWPWCPWWDLSHQLLASKPPHWRAAAQVTTKMHSRMFQQKEHRCSKQVDLQLSAQMREQRAMVVLPAEKTWAMTFSCSCTRAFIAWWEPSLVGDSVISLGSFNSSWVAACSLFFFHEKGKALTTFCTHPWMTLWVLWSLTLPKNSILTHVGKLSLSKMVNEITILSRNF